MTFEIICWSKAKTSFRVHQISKGTMSMVVDRSFMVYCRPTICIVCCFPSEILEIHTIITLTSLRCISGNRRGPSLLSSWRSCRKLEQNLCHLNQSTNCLKMRFVSCWVRGISFNVALLSCTCADCGMYLSFFLCVFFASWKCYTLNKLISHICYSFSSIFHVNSNIWGNHTQSWI